MNATVFHLIACCAALGTEPAAMPKNPIFETLTTQGVLMPSGSRIQLPPPIMAANMTAEQQGSALALTASAARATVADFSAKNSSAPLLMKVQTLHTNPTYRTIDIAFVARGKWSVLTDPEFGKKILKNRKAVPGQANDTNNTVVKAGFLSKEEMNARDLKPAADIDKTPIARKEAWLQTTFNLFSQAQVSATRHVIITKGPTSALFAAMIDSQFKKDAEYPNQWRAINAPGVPLGAPQPYSGAGFYIKAVSLAQPEDAIFFEYHSIFYEPFGWFNGDAAIRSNLPKAAMFQTKQFRIKLAIASEESQAVQPPSNSSATIPQQRQ